MASKDFRFHDQLEDLDDTFERFGDRGHRLARKPSRKRSVKDLTDTKSIGIKFDDFGLQAIYEQGHFDDLLYQLKSGKEATVYVVSSAQGLLAAKIYRDLKVRSFKNDAIYRAGRFIGDVRTEKAIKKRSQKGLLAQQSLWVNEEFLQMKALYAAGVLIPKPIACEGNVVLMEFIGDESGAAPRISEARLERDEAEFALQQSIENLIKIVKSGRVHGDYSAFNILWWQEKAIVIDFPQVVCFDTNPNAIKILRRDIEGLCNSFRTFGLKPNPDKIWHQIKQYTK